jgi:hypothetical protein
VVSGTGRKAESGIERLTAQPQLFIPDAAQPRSGIHFDLRTAKRKIKLDSGFCAMRSPGMTSISLRVFGFRVCVFVPQQV